VIPRRLAPTLGAAALASNAAAESDEPVATGAPSCPHAPELP